MSALRLLIVDDHPLFREGLALQLARRQPATTVLQAADAQAIEAALAQEPDLLLLDWSVPGLDAVPLILRLAALPSPIPVVVVSATENIADIAAALDAGALGFVPKSLEPEDLTRAVDQVLAGQLFLPAAIARQLASWRRSRSAPTLSPRQVEVLALLEAGHSNRQIAETLTISEATVKSHVNALLNLFGTDNRTACVHQARSLGLLG